MLWSGKH